MFNKLLLTDTSGKKSATLTAFVLGFMVVNLKLIFSGMSFGDFTLSAFTGSEYGIALGALGGIYILRRSTTKENNDESK